MTAPLKLSVVMSTYNRRDVLVSRALPAIFNQDLPADEFEVILIVDGATDGTGGALRELHPAAALRIVEQPNRGLSASRNTGIGMAQGELIIFIDDDIICRPDVLPAACRGAHGARCGRGARRSFSRLRVSCFDSHLRQRVLVPES